VPGDAKGLVTADLTGDGWPDLVVSRNNSTMLAFRHPVRPGRHSTQLVLQGTPGNPAAIGARVRVEYADGTAATSELAANSGFQGQSPAAVFVGWTDQNPVRHIEVRWPSGASSSLDGAPAIPTLVLHAPHN
jgi:hypothetical protein